MNITSNKTCSKCLQEKDYGDFYKAKSNRDGLQKWCKKCDNDRCLPTQRARQRRLGKKERVPQRLADELKTNGLRKCPGCKETKVLSSFYESKNSNGGYSSHCIICCNEFSKNSYKKYGQEYYRRDKLTRKDTKLREKFGITINEYNRMLQIQNGVCAICNTKEDNKALAVDHNHKTNEIRGLLCGRCNPAVGYLQDNPELARKLADYLDYHSNKERNFSTCLI